jgi:hypothetical protein
MTEEETKDALDAPPDDEPPPSDAELEAQEQAMRDLLAKAKVREEPAPSAPILPAVQRKIRKRSKGKFFADGWSTEASRVSYGLVAVLMLVVLAIAYFALGPVGVTTH